MNNNLVRHILQWIFVFAAALASVFTLQSCGLEEPFPGPQSGISEGTVEFVVRPVSFNDHDVATKADGNPATFEDDEIHNAFLLVFDAYGQRLLCEEISLNTEAGGLTAEYDQLSAKIDRALGTVTVCVLANVPKNFAEGIIGTTNPGGASANLYLDTAVLDLTYDSSVSDILGVPVLDLDNDSSTPAVACIPMFGQSSESIDLSNYTAPYQIFIKRLFAKATVSLKMNLTNSGSGMQANSYMQMVSYSLCDLPYKVKLTEPTENDYESAWVKNTGTVSVCQSNSKIYNQAANGYITNLPKELVFHCYAPEYYLLPKPDGTDGYGNEKYKPKMYDYDSKNPKHPIYIQLVGSYEPVSGVSQNLIYKIYLGEDNATNFTLKRNTYYKNYLVIEGVENNKDGEGDNIDHRVEISQGDVVSMYGEVANCYMIGKEGTYNFPAYKGAYKYAQLKDAPRCTSKIARILTRDNDGIWLEDENITVVTDELTQEQIITINVTDGDNTEGEDITTAAAGNAILALYDDNGNVEWSWHLWFTGGLNWGVGNIEFFEMDTQAYPSGVQMMDRNLGSHPSATQSTAPGIATGLYYKYGDKNPYIGGGYIEGGTYGNLTWNPSDDANNEDNTKAVNDPCPPGYKVPSSSVWSSMGSKSTLYEAYLYSGDDNALNNTVDIYYPFLDDAIVDKTYFSGTYRHTGTYADEIKTDYGLTTSYPYYRNIEYYIDITYLSGSVLASDNIQFIYEAANQGLLSDTQITQFESKSSRWSSWKTTTVNNNSITSSILNLLLESIKSPIESSINEIINKTQKKDASTSYGYQVRCVKE